MRSVSSSTIRCRQRRNSATKARPTTRGYGQLKTRPASSFSSTAVTATARDRCRRASRHGRRAKPLPRSPAGTASRPNAWSSRGRYPLAIDAGVFHNDVIAVGHGHALFCHELAYVEQHAVLAELAQRVGPAFTPVIVEEAEVNLADAVAN